MTRPRVLVVRSGANPFLKLGSRAGVEVVERLSHTIERVPVADGAFGPPADLAIFTSQVAVEYVETDPRLARLFAEAASGAQVCAVGPATAEALRNRGIAPQVVAPGSVEDLLERLPPALDGKRVLFPCGEDAAEDLPQALRSRGAHVSRVVVYRKIPVARDPALEQEILERPFAAFCATSPSAADWLFSGLGRAAAERLKQTPAVVLGRFTRRALEARGVETIAVTGEPRFASALDRLTELATAPGGA